MERKRNTKVHFSLRLRQATVERLIKQARFRRLAKTQLAEQYIEEGVRMAEHPGIVFRDAAGGRRAALPGSRLDVWQVVETVLANGKSVEAAARYLAISPTLVEAAVGYYADFKDEVDEFIARNAAMARDAEEAWQRRRTVITGD